MMNKRFQGKVVVVSEAGWDKIMDVNHAARKFGVIGITQSLAAGAAGRLRPCEGAAHPAVRREGP